MTDYTKLRPLGARVLVQRYPLSRMSEGGVYVIGLDYPTLGKVLAVGPGWRQGRSCKLCFCGKTKEYYTHNKHHHFAPLWKAGDYYKLDIHVGDDVQWRVDSNFDLHQLSPDLFLFNYEDLNLVGSE